MVYHRGMNSTKKIVFYRFITRHATLDHCAQSHDISRVIGTNLIRRVRAKFFLFFSK